jgi:hypothetical protein
MKLNAGGSTVRVMLEDAPPWLARILVDPGETPVASPVLLIVATEVLEEVHVAVLVTSRVPPPANVPVATNDCFLPTKTDGEAGVMTISVRSESSTKKSPHPNTSSAQTSNAQNVRTVRRFIVAV